MPLASPPVPLTIEGSAVLHQMFRLRWNAWHALSDPDHSHILDQAIEGFQEMETAGPAGSAVYSLLGHKGDLMLVHFRNDFEALHQVQAKIRRLRLNEFLEPTSSYLSVIELGLYESSQKTYGSLTERGVEPFSAEWNAAIQETMSRQREAMAPRLFPEIPPSRYICFYPMDRRRGEQKNWYIESMAERVRMMHEHGLVGRRYAGEVRQIITGSIGFDDWEWGVDLFADNPLVFKQLIYEMRFDEVSAMYALFGSFYIGLRHRPDDLRQLLSV